MVVTVYTRHSKTCLHREDRNYRRCGCPLWLEYFFNHRQHRRSAKTRSFERANQDARALELRLEASARGETVPNPVRHITVEDAITRHLAARELAGKCREASAVRRHENMLDRLKTFCNSKGILFLKDVTADHLHEFRQGWQFKKYDDGGLSPSWKIHWSCIKGLFTRAARMWWVMTNEADKLETPSSSEQKVHPFSKEQMKAIFGAVEKLVWPDDRKQMVRTLILLMRWSGLSIGDALTLPRVALDKQGRIWTFRRKTKEDVFIPLPPAVAEALRALPEKEYFWWDGQTKAHTVVVQYTTLLSDVFAKAGVKGTSHQFRHTFACESLAAGVPLEDVSKLLGHSSIKTTERYYAAWIKGRQSLLETTVREAWANMELPT